MTEYSEYGPALSRLFLGLLFLVPGLMKLLTLAQTGTHMAAGMLWGSVALVWVLAIVEVLGGLAVLLGWKIEWAAWPLVLIMLGAIFLAVLPGREGNPMWSINLLFHLVAAAGLVNLALAGPGAFAVGSK